jgi:hypothetical protein
VVYTSRALAALRPNYIKIPQNRNEINECKQKFFNIARFPNCIGAIDCSHDKIQSVGEENAEITMNQNYKFKIFTNHKPPSCQI